VNVAAMRAAWTLRFRLGLWLCIAAIWWWQTAALAERNGALRDERERVRLVQEVAELEQSLRELMPLVPESSAQDRAWWVERFRDRARVLQLDLERCTAASTSCTAGAFAMVEITCVASGPFVLLLELQGWVESLLPRAHTVAIDMVPAPHRRATATLKVLVPVLEPGRR
jgi:hypothetical protein